MKFSPRAFQFPLPFFRRRDESDAHIISFLRLFPSPHFRIYFHDDAGIFSLMKVGMECSCIAAMKVERRNGVHRVVSCRGFKLLSSYKCQIMMWKTGESESRRTICDAIYFLYNQCECVCVQQTALTVIRFDT